MMLVEIVLIILSLTVLLVAAIFDIRTKEIPDTLSYGFIIAALGISLLYSISASEYNIFFLNTLGFVVMLTLGIILYYLKIWGGGDSKLLMGLGAATSAFNISGFPFISILLIMITLVGGVYAFGSALLMYKSNFKKVNKEMKSELEKNKINRVRLLLFAFVFVILIFFVSNSGLQIILSIIAVTIILLFYIHIFVSVIHKVGFLEETPLSKVTEGDWLAKDVKVRGKIICSAKSPCIDKKQITLLKKHKISKVWIKVGIPFVPAIFIAMVITTILYVVL